MTGPARTLPRVDLFSQIWFSPAMAVGIVSVASRAEGHRTFSWLLTAIDVLVFLGLAEAALERRSRLLAISDYRRGAGQRRTLPVQALTVVPALAVLGTRVVVAGGAGRILAAALAVPSALALVLIAAAGARAWRSMPQTWRQGVGPGTSGSWLLAVVAPQSLVILGAGLAQHGLRAPLPVLIGLWLIGLAAYVPIGGALAVRLVKRRRPEDLTPDHWIVMGALAITAVAASNLLIADTGASNSAWHDVLHVGGQATWILASGVIPLLVAAEIWRLHRLGFSWTPPRWSTVFPLGMYALASRTTAATWPLAPLYTCGTVAFWVAVGALALTAANTMRALAIGCRTSDRKR